MDSNIKKIYNIINGEVYISPSDSWIPKFNPDNEELESYLISSDSEDIKMAIESSVNAFNSWSKISPIERGEYLRALVDLMREYKNELIEIVSRETGKSLKDSAGEVNAAIQQGFYFSSEGMRLHGKTFTSLNVNKYTHSVRMPLGVSALIVPANTPIANIAWKLFPALICGNTVIIKASEDAPEIAQKVGLLAIQAKFPPGVINIIQGSGAITGKLLVENEQISLISFTGSTNVGKWIAKKAAESLTRVSLELGGKNHFIVCKDANIENAVKWAILSAFSNAGQRCAAGSKIIVEQEIYSQFVNMLIERTKKLKLGIKEDCDYGPVINEKQYFSILETIRESVKNGGNILCGGIERPGYLKKGFYIQPTLIENLPINSEILIKEIFGPVATIEKFSNLKDVLENVNNSEYGLTCAIHSENFDKAIWFAQNVRVGVANVNIGTFGSEPHYPFGGFRASGNGTREPGIEALNVYTELKNISYTVQTNFINE
jgi:acyl-CoA reductase-like NAD-dependent aldehyde dehydrogenase